MFYTHKTQCQRLVTWRGSSTCQSKTLTGRVHGWGQEAANGAEEQKGKKPKSTNFLGPAAQDKNNPWLS